MLTKLYLGYIDRHELQAFLSKYNVVLTEEEVNPPRVLLLVCKRVCEVGMRWATACLTWRCLSQFSEVLDFFEDDQRDNQISYTEFVSAIEGKGRRHPLRVNYGTRGPSGGIIRYAS